MDLMDLKKILIILIALCMTVLPVSAQGSEETAEADGQPAPAAPLPEFPVDTETSVLIGFYWQPAENAENYEVTWRNDAGAQGTLELKAGDGTCLTGSCIAYEEVPGAGTYTWTVTASNGAGSAASEEKTFTVRAGIPEPDAYRPNTALSSQKALTFEWQDVGAGPEEYRIQVLDRDSESICVDRTIPKTSVFAVNGVCYIESGMYLPEGNYSWRVKGQNAAESSGWSAWQDFQLSCADCALGNYLNTVTAALSPNGKVTDPEVRFEWLAVTGAVEYRLTVKDPEGADVLDVTVPSSDCTAFTCTYDPDFEIVPDAVYTWSVSTYGYGGGRWGTAESTLELTHEISPEPVAFISPADQGMLDPEDPQVIWTDPGSSAAAFRLIICDAEGEALLYTDLTREDAWCDGQTCSIVFMEIPEGDGYRIYVTPYSETNTPGTAAALTFSCSYGTDQPSETD